ncbi:hypothetical protein AGDE_15618 [Angomonas deanei]|uniref:Uncharacterized protein n=1 Tax=Angomonas deanei TaxID=59799 RepID=A0A7G2CMW6_9TRYP|nr:hypothetical protein AGDE_15618 [Angomonas deanei]CAD2220765.1 hypothetical protein, conserved [Angomonas deanei]|eukprot:EPY18761.1 hypothetical protein AGDE_15618 [Angomonas deanei]
MEATRETQEKLKKAWNEYILSAGQYFTSTVQALSDEIQALREERDDIEVGSSSSRQAVSASNTNTAGMGETITSATGSFNKKANPLGVSQSSFMSHDSYADSLLRRPVAVRAERLNELCNTCDKWLRKNERLFVLPQPEVLVEIVRQCVSSTSQLFRLLGLHLAAGCVGNKTFTQILLNDQLCVLWISLCADREVVAELGEFLDLAEALIDALDLTMHRYPYSWINRIASLLRTGDPTASVPAKRRSQGIRIALHLTKKSIPTSHRRPSAYFSITCLHR